MTQEVKLNDKDLVQFKHFSIYDTLRHCFTTRHGGVSSGAFSTLNMGFGRGDARENVIENYLRVADSLELDINDFVLSNQVHGENIIRVTANNCGNGIVMPQMFEGNDGFVTNEKNVVLTTFYADCVPLFFYDPIHECIGMSHAGWKGSVLKIGAKTIEKMTTEFGTNPRDVLVGIGPSIGACCYEVGDDVKKQFDLSFNDDIIANVIEYHSKKVHIDLWEANRRILLDAGVSDNHIEISKLCTKCNNARFFSHREHGSNRGSQVGIIALV